MTRERIVIQNIEPQLQNGEFFIKRVVGELIEVTADVLGDGHDVLQAEICYKWENSKNWETIRLTPLENDVYTGVFNVENQGFYDYKVSGWIDHALNWQHGIEAKLKDGQYVKSELLDGIQYIKAIEKQLDKEGKKYLKNAKEAFADEARYNVF